MTRCEELALAPGVEATADSQGDVGDGRARIAPIAGSLVLPENFHDFFVAAAGVAGALVGLLFVAVSVTAGAARPRRARASCTVVRRVGGADVVLQRAGGVVVRAHPGIGIAWPAISVAVLGLFFVAASLLSLLRLRGRHHSGPRDALFLAGQTIAFVIQLIAGDQRGRRGEDAGATRAVAVIVIVSFLIGIARAWELIGGPEIGLFHELKLLGRGEPGLV